MKSEGEMTFLQHLEELRWVIIKSLIGIVVGATLVFFFKDIVFDIILLGPRNPDFISNRLLCRIGGYLGTPSLCINVHPAPLQNITMGGQFNMHIWIAIIGGLILAFPYVFYQFWSFVAPALREKERKAARGAVVVSSLLFMIGIMFGYFILLPFSIDFLTTYSVSDLVENHINFVSYISNVTSVVLACGLVFELPIVVYFLSSVGIVTPTLMKKFWRHAVVIILIIAAIITPPDWVSQVLVAVPLFALYMGSISISAWVVRKRERKGN
jgi:sec-independent protein translocase protein TatC